MKTNTVADLWETSTESVTESSKAQLKAKMLTGTYMLQAMTKRQKQHEQSGTCRLCGQGDEDRLHFIATCSALDGIRQNWAAKMVDFLERHGLGDLDWRQDHELLMQASLDCRGFLSRTGPPAHYAVYELERLSREMLTHLHKARWVMLEKLNV